MSSYTILTCNSFGIIGALNFLPGAKIGWLVIGLGIGAFALNLAAGKLKERKITLLMETMATALFLGLGYSGIAGTLSGFQVGLGTVLIPPVILATAMLVHYIISVSRQTA